MIVKLICELSYAAFYVSSLQRSDGAESLWDSSQLFYIKVMAIVMRFSKVLLIPLYFKCPQSMRFLMIVDALDRIVFSLLPCDLILLVRDMPYILAIDIFCNYCLDFWASLAVLWVEIALIFTLNNMVNLEEPNESLKLCLLLFLVMTMIFVLLAVFVGSIFIKGYELAFVLRQDEKLTYNKKEGVVVMTKDDKKITFMNKSAQQLLIGKAESPSHQDGDLIAANFTAIRKIFKRVLLRNKSGIEISGIKSSINITSNLEVDIDASYDQSTNIYSLSDIKKEISSTRARNEEAVFIYRIIDIVDCPLIDEEQ